MSDTMYFDDAMEGKQRGKYKRSQLEREKQTRHYGKLFGGNKVSATAKGRIEPTLLDCEEDLAQASLSRRVATHTSHKLSQQKSAPNNDGAPWQQRFAQIFKQNKTASRPVDTPLVTSVNPALPDFGDLPSLTASPELFSLLTIIAEGDAPLVDDPDWVTVDASDAQLIEFD